MFKRSRYRSSYARKANRRRISPLVILLSIPLLLILLELLTRMFVGIAGKTAELAVYSGEPPIVNAYRLQFLSSTLEPFEGVSNRGLLEAQRQVSVGYQLLGEQESPFWRINEQGFREDDSIPLQKPEGEIRIFILGNSTAFGYWNESNADTIAAKLEQRINERVTQQQSSPEKYRPDVFPFFKPLREQAFALPPKIREGNYRVINAAVPGYTSGNQLAQFALQILPYQPDLIVVLDGYTDLMLPSFEQATDVPKVDDFLTNAPFHFGMYLFQPLQEGVKRSYFVKAIQYWLIKPEPSVAEKSLVVLNDSEPLVAHLPNTEEELEARLSRYYNHHVQMVRLSAGFSIPLVVAVQPEITGRPPSILSPEEREMRDELGTVYAQRMEESYAELIEASQRLEKAFPQNVKVLNFYNFYEDFSGVAFYDAIHLTGEANTALATQLYTTITSLEKMQIIPKYFDL